jgi:thioredoxin 1
VTTTTNFETEVLASEVPVLVEYWAEWCGPCRMMAPLLDEAARLYDGRIRVAKVNVDEEAALAQRYNVRSIPTMMIFRNGHPQATQVGAVNRSRLEDFIEAQLKAGQGAAGAPLPSPSTGRS